MKVSRSHSSDPLNYLCSSVSKGLGQRSQIRSVSLPDTLTIKLEPSCKHRCPWCHCFWMLHQSAAYKHMITANVSLNCTECGLHQRMKNKLTKNEVKWAWLCEFTSTHKCTHVMCVCLCVWGGDANMYFITLLLSWLESLWKIRLHSASEASCNSHANPPTDS